MFDTEKEEIEGTYPVEITLTDQELHSTSYNLIVNVLPDPSNTPPYFEDEWSDTQPIQLYFDGEEVEYAFPLPIDDENDSVTIDVNIDDID